MERIGVRQLRQHASVWLRRVADGESFEVTDRGRPVALLAPLPVDDLRGLELSGELDPADGDLLDQDPLLPRPGAPLPSEVLEQMRADER